MDGSGVQCTMRIEHFLCSPLSASTYFQLPALPGVWGES